MKSTTPMDTFAINETTDRQPSTQFGSLAEQLVCWRSHLDQYKHPVVLFDANSWPIVLNKTFQQLIMDRTSIENAEGETVSQLWKAVCESTGEIVAKAVSASGRNEIAEFFPLHGRNFVVLGSLLRGPQGRIVGAVMNLAEISPSADAGQRVFRNSVAGSSPEGVQGPTCSPGEFEKWLVQRDGAREKISMLSNRETQVAAFVADGYPNRRIATALGVSVKTIEKHRANACAKLNAGSTAELVRIFVCAGEPNPLALSASLN